MAVGIDRVFSVKVAGKPLISLFPKTDVVAQVIPLGVEAGWQVPPPTVVVALMSKAWAPIGSHGTRAQSASIHSETMALASRVLVTS